jgi:uncharacterized membrane protein (DUF4010 family)
MDLAEELYRYGVALAIGALVGMERQSRPEEPAPGDEPGAEAPEPEPAPATEEAVRARVAAGESYRLPAATPDPVPEEARAGEGDGADASNLEEPTFAHHFREAAGLRTFVLLALGGAVSATLSATWPWVFPVALLAVGLLTAAGYIAMIRIQGDYGLTSEVAAIVVFLLGGMAALGETELAGAAAVVVTVVLSHKRMLHSFAYRVRKEDIQAVVKFAVLTFVILPVLPEEPLVLGELVGNGVADGVAPVASEVAAVAPPAGPPAGEPPWWAGLTISPRKIWYMVILISGISFAGYVLGKWLGTGRGLVVTGIVGGLVSSTAVSLSYAQKSCEAPDHSRQLAIGILLANAIMPLRLLVVVGVIAPPLLLPLAAPLLAMTGLAVVFSLVLRRREGGPAAMTEQVPLKNPFELGPAFQFGLLFGVVLFFAQVAQQLFGDAGMYGIAVLTGLTDVDAISLAVANLVADGGQLAKAGAITVALAAVSNTVVKGGFVATLGSPQLRKITLLAFGLMTLAAAAGIAGIALVVA